MFYVFLRSLLQLLIGFFLLFFLSHKLPSSAAEIAQEAGGFVALGSEPLKNVSVHEISLIVKNNLPVTLSIAFLTVLFSTVVAVPLGVYLSLKSNSSFLSKLMRHVFHFLASIPSLITAPLFLWLLGLHGPRLSFSYDATPGSYLLPVLSLSLGLTSSLSLMVEQSFKNVLHQNFILTAHAKGLSFFTVLRKHVFSNSIIPIASYLIDRFSHLISGAVVVEAVFGFPGMGELLSKSLYSRNIPMLQGCLIVFLILAVGMNIWRELILLRYAR